MAPALAPALAPGVMSTTAESIFHFVSWVTSTKKQTNKMTEVLEKLHSVLQLNVIQSKRPVCLPALHSVFKVGIEG